MNTKKRIKALEQRVAALEEMPRHTARDGDLLVDGFRVVEQDYREERPAYEWLTSEADPSDCYIAGDKPGFQHARAEVRKKLDGNGDTVWWWTVHGVAWGVESIDLDATKAKCEALLSETVTPEKEATAEGVTVWQETIGGEWYRAPEGCTFFDALGTVAKRGDRFEAAVWLDGKEESVGLHDTRSAAMLATDNRLREAGVVLPETVKWTGSQLAYTDSGVTAWWSAEHHPHHVRHGVYHPGVVERAEQAPEATTLPEALAILDAHGVDTAIARAMLREREAAEEATAEGVTLGAWRESGGEGEWYRAKCGEGFERCYGTAGRQGDAWDAYYWSNGGLAHEDLGTFPTLSSAMLATDARLREAGVGLPETVVLVTGWLVHLPALECGGNPIAWVESSGEVMDFGSEIIGHATTIQEALAILDAHGVDTAIARAMLREREAAEEATAEGVTLGAWHLSEFGEGLRVVRGYDPSLPASLGRVDWNGAGDGGDWIAMARNGLGCEWSSLGTFATWSEAALATDDRLREAGVVLPETVRISQSGVALVSCLPCGVDGYLCWEPGALWTPTYASMGKVGEASTLPEALAILDRHGVDTAIARAMLREREAGEPDHAQQVVDALTEAGLTARGWSEATPYPGYAFAAFHAEHGTWVSHTIDELVVKCQWRTPADPLATRKAAAEGWGWRFLIPLKGLPSWSAHHADHPHDEMEADLPDLLDAIEAREVEAAEGRGWAVYEPCEDDENWVAQGPVTQWARGESRHDLITAIHEAEAREAEPAKDHYAPAYQRLVITAEYSREDEGWIAETDKTNDLSAFGATIEECIRGMADVWSMADECDSLIFDAAEPARPLEGVVLSGVWEQTPERDFMLSSTMTVRLVWLPASTGAWTINRDDAGGRHYIATGIGTRADAIDKARELGAEVAS